MKAVKGLAGSTTPEDESDFDRRCREQYEKFVALRLAAIESEEEETRRLRAIAQSLHNATSQMYKAVTSTKFIPISSRTSNYNTSVNNMIG